MDEQSINQIKEVVDNYFKGIYNGNVDLLRATFQDSTILYGNVKGKHYENPLETYLETVANRKSPAELGEAFKMKILTTEIVGAISMVEAHVPMLGFNYHDFLSLMKVQGKWKIVGKTFTDV